MKKYLDLFKNYSIVFLVKSGLKEIKRRLWREMILGSYAQDGEDLIIEKILKKNKGSYLEIGAYHPTRLSNTYRFYKKGWRGTVIEPNPEARILFEKMRPGDNFHNVGIGEKETKLNYYKFLIPALNTFSKTESEKSIRKGHKIVGVEKIKTIRVNKIAGKFDLLSIDTEGFDQTILKQWPWKKFRPKVVCVETDKEINDEFLEKQNYKVFFRNQSNTIYCLRK